MRYLADLPEHAVGEALSPFRATTFRPAYLRLQGHPLALVEVTLAERVMERLADCTDPKVLDRLAVRPDELAHHDRALTQAIARRIHVTDGPLGAHTGLRWWSALTGAWHTTVVFTDRVGAGDVSFGEPRPLTPHDPALVRARLVLGIRAR